MCPNFAQKLSKVFRTFFLRVLEQMSSEISSRYYLN